MRAFFCICKCFTSGESKKLENTYLKSSLPGNNYSFHFPTISIFEGYCIYSGR